MVSSSISSPSLSKSCSTGITPLAVRSLISWLLFSSQLVIYALLRTRSGRPYKAVSSWIRSKLTVEQPRTSESKQRKKVHQFELSKGLAYREDNSADVVIEARCANSFLVGLWRTSFFSEDESSTDPNSTSTKHQSSCEGCAIEDTCKDIVSWNHSITIETEEDTIPPAATTWTGWPSPLFLPLQSSTTAGIKTAVWISKSFDLRTNYLLVGTSPVCPPPSPPCAHIKSTPRSRHFLTCFGCPIMFIYRTPCLCSLSTTACGGTPTAETNSLAPLSIIISTNSPSLPFV